MDIRDTNAFGEHGIYLGDGEWMSWDDFGEEEPDLDYGAVLPRLEAEDQLARRYPEANVIDLRQFLRLLNACREYQEETRRHLNIHGALGELYGAVRFGVRLHTNATAQGSDGRIGNDFVEIKTLGPRNTSGRVVVKLEDRNFSKLLLVRITEDFQFRGCLVPRKELTKAKTGNAGLAWSRALEIAERIEPEALGRSPFHG